MNWNILSTETFFKGLHFASLETLTYPNKNQ